MKVFLDSNAFTCFFIKSPVFGIDSFWTEVDEHSETEVLKLHV